MTSLYIFIPVYFKNAVNFYVTMYFNTTNCTILHKGLNIGVAA